jgi:hypothetical protein
MSNVILKSTLSALVLTACFATQSNAAPAYTQEELGEATSVLYQQLEKIDGMNPRTCPQDHAPIFAGKSLEVALYYGYEDYEDVTADSVHARAMADVLQHADCSANVVACKFKLVSRTRNVTRLTKQISGKTVNISIYSTSVTASNSKNMNEGQREQERQSKAVKALFHRDLVKADIVFYAGHSRYGGGLGFNSQTTMQALWENISRLPLRPMMTALATRPSRLKLLGLFSCKSDQYFRIPVEERNPGINQLVTNDDILPDEGEQQSIGALNAILGRKCEAELQESLIAVSAPSHRAVRYIRRPF